MTPLALAEAVEISPSVFSEGTLRRAEHKSSEALKAGGGYD